ncbi:: PilZ [Gemmata massiliana]|uniref:: PilZ n=1 Tax=Gemmata massiliana TaxID=1210884 RepID=A0A6P2CXS1_9BACT|nr:PilZ domain-containing protein [Gemmata massiliana]VTR91932.1 : PilZ [Gemmata massiliana]
MADAKDRRAAERMAVNAGTGCGFVGPVAENFGPAKVRDVSLDGIGLVLTRRVEIGTLLALTLTNATQKLSKTVLVRVAHVTASHGGFLVGGTFAEPLTYQELTSFVM